MTTQRYIELRRQFWSGSSSFHPQPVRLLTVCSPSAVRHQEQRLDSTPTDASRELPPTSCVSARLRQLLNDSGIWRGGCVLTGSKERNWLYTVADIPLPL